MVRSALVRIAMILIAGAVLHASAYGDESKLEQTRKRFLDHSGAEIVFSREDLPAGRYHNVLIPLEADMKAEAATICLREVKKYPRHYFREVGLKAIGIFAACVSKTGDGYRALDRELGGYRYFGIYNGSNAVAAAYYDTFQLPLTFHHEVFHHIDSTVQGETAAWQLSSDDAVYHAVLTGAFEHAAPSISSVDVSALRRRGRGNVLKDAVNDYAAKNAREDQAETARHVMSHLPDALLQVIEQPTLPGSQRILHVLGEYRNAAPDGPEFDWFVDVALNRIPSDADRLLSDMDQQIAGLPTGQRAVPMITGQARSTLRAIGRLESSDVSKEQAAKSVQLACELTSLILTERIRPNRKHDRFAVFGPEDSKGVNWTLRKDIESFGLDSIRLFRIASLDPSQSELLTRTQLKQLRLIARYYRYIASNWSVTPGTLRVFEESADRITDSLPPEQAVLARDLKQTKLNELAWRIPEDGSPTMLLGKYEQ